MGTRTGVDASTSLTVPISGMTCASCEKRVTASLSTVPGVRSVRVSAARGTATVRGEAPLDRARLDAAIRSAGYEPTAAPWLSRDRSLWRTVLVRRGRRGCAGAGGRPRRAGRPHLGAVRPGPRWPAARARAGCHGGPVDLHGHGRRAGARLLRLARSHPRDPGRGRTTVPDPDATPARLQRGARRRFRRARRPARRRRVDDEPAHAGDRRAGPGRRRGDVPPRHPAHRHLAAGGRLVPEAPGRVVAGPRHRHRRGRRLPPLAHRPRRRRHVLPAVRLHPGRAGLRPVDGVTGGRERDHGDLRRGHDPRAARPGLGAGARHRAAAGHRAARRRRAGARVRAAQRLQRPEPPGPVGRGRRQRTVRARHPRTSPSPTAPRRCA